jgi:uncharacterized membrane protein YfcA
MSLDPILQMSDLFALLIVFAGGFVRGYTGFGSGLVMTPLFAILWGPVDAVATTAGLSLLATVQLTASSVPLANWRDVAPMLAAVLYFLAIPDAARIQRANIIIVMGCTGTAVLVALIIAGVVTSTVFITIGVLAMPSIAAVWLGARLFTVLPVRLFRLIVLWFLVAVSVVILAT